MMVAFILGLMLGGCCGVVTMCIMTVADDEDRRMEQYLTEHEPKAQPDP